MFSASVFSLQLHTDFPNYCFGVFPPDREVIILFSVGNEIRQYLLSRKEYSNVVSVSARSPQALGVDPVRRLVYWMDSGLHSISRTLVSRDPLKSSVSQTLHVSSDLLGKLADISVDWVAQLVSMRLFHWTLTWIFYQCLLFVSSKLHFVSY